MTWLSGKFRKVISLYWPSEDPRAEVLKKYRYSTDIASLSSPYSVLDDQILRAVIEQNTPASYVYIARIYEAIKYDHHHDEVTFAVCAVLPYAVRQVALLPQRTGFASLAHNKEDVTIILRVHNWDGSVLKEVSARAEATHARLVIQGDLIGICVSSGEEKPESADEIIVWNYKTGSLYPVKIPKNSSAPFQHRGNFQFVDQSFIALGATLSHEYGRPSAILSTFDFSGQFARDYSHGENFEMDDDFDVVCTSSSSSKPDDILVNYHQRGNRITIFKKDLLKDTVKSSPDSSDPEGYHMVWSHKGYFRTMSGTVSEYLPAVCDNRVLLAFEIGYDHALCDFAIDNNSVIRRVLYICDYDQGRCNALLSVNNRTCLEDQIKADNKDAQVTVVQRDYSASIEEDEDMEYPRRWEHPEWTEHLKNRWEIEEQRREGDSDTPILEFDEGPSETKENPRLIFTRSLVWLPPDEYRHMKTSQLALSSSGIIHIADPGEEGHIFVFE